MAGVDWRGLKQTGETWKELHRTRENWLKRTGEDYKKTGEDYTDYVMRNQT